jgi:hypothetical protein
LESVTTLKALVQAEKVLVAVAAVAAVEVV